MCIRDRDKLFQADALDVNADIAALEGMLNLDGMCIRDRGTTG